MTARSVRSATCFMALAALTVLPAFAQQDDARRGEGAFGRGRGGPSFGGGMGGASVDRTMISLLQVPQVREEVEVMPDQEDALEKLQETNRPERPDFGNFRDASEDERREMFEKMRKTVDERTAKMRAGLEEILLPEQLDRLQQIAVQAIGAEALNDPKIAKQLKVTDQQKEKIAKVREESQDSMREKMRELFSSGDRDAVRAKMEEFRKEIEQKIANTLTSEQQTEFAAMKGKPFDMPEGALRSSFGGPRDGGRGGDRDGGGDRGGDRGDRRPPRGGGDN